MSSFGADRSQMTIGFASAPLKCDKEFELWEFTSERGAGWKGWAI